jgi:hypothetical protein
MPKIHGPAEGHWHALLPRGVVTRLAEVNVPWWVAGGWALDLFLGFTTRSHGDLDIGVLRRDIADVLARLAGWEFFEADSGTLYRLEPDERPRPNVNSLWCRPRGVDTWSLELLLDEADGDTWVFRRLPTITMPLPSAIKHTADGIPYLAPQIQLLYKARSPRRKDEADFEHVLVRLEPAEREWLYDALARVNPEHPWLAKLRP